MRIYAALFASTFGEWPSNLRLVPLAGLPVDVKFSEDGCRNLVDNATQLLKSTQHLIENHRGQGRALMEDLAQPGPEICRSCLFRPGCPSYMSGVPRSTNGEGWPLDVAGTLTEFRRQQDGRIGLSLRCESPSKRILRIRGITDDIDRHPALQEISPGDRLSLFSLARGGSPTMLAEGPMTTAYRLRAQDE